MSKEQREGFALGHKKVGKLSKTSKNMNFSSDLLVFQEIGLHYQRITHIALF